MNDYIKQKYQFDLKPTIKVGEFCFGDDVSNIFASKNLIRLPDEEENGVEWKVFTLPEVDVRIFTENDKIVSVACYETCFYKNKNIISLGIDEAINLLNVNVVKDDEQIIISNEEQEIYNADELGLQLWVNKAGTVVSVFCNSGT